MPINWRASSMLCGLCAGVLACDGPERGPVAPDIASMKARPAHSLPELTSPRDEKVGPGNASVPVPSGGKAGGHADIHGTEVQNVRDQAYSFTAVSTGAFPLAKGRVKVHFLRFTGEEIKVHAEVTCLSVEGNQAWVGSRVTKFVADGQEVPTDRRMIFRVQDVGEGHDAVDLASLVFFVAPGEDLAYCDARPAFPILRQSTIGNIRVKTK